MVVIREKLPKIKGQKHGMDPERERDLSPPTHLGGTMREKKNIEPKCEVRDCSVVLLYTTISAIQKKNTPVLWRKGKKR